MQRYKQEDWIFLRLVEWMPRAKFDENRQLNTECFRKLQEWLKFIKFYLLL
jgi:hypothetical protein